MCINLLMHSGTGFKNLPVDSKLGSPGWLNSPAWRMLDLWDVHHPAARTGEELPKPSAQRTSPAACPLSPAMKQCPSFLVSVYTSQKLFFDSLSHPQITTATPNLQARCKTRDTPHTPVMFAQSASSSLAASCFSPIQYDERSSCAYSTNAFLCPCRPAIGPQHHVSRDRRTHHISNTMALAGYTGYCNHAVLLHSPCCQFWPVE